MRRSLSKANLEPDEQVKSNVMAEQMRMLLANTPSICLFASLFAIVLSLYITNHTTAKSSAFFWLGLKLFVATLRVFHAYKLIKAETKAIDRSINIILLLVLLDGITWGLAGPILLPGLDQQAGTILGCSLMGIVAIATFTLHVLLKAMLAYCLPILTIPAVTYFFLDEHFGWFIGLGLMIFLFGFISVGRRANANVTEMLWRRFSMDIILSDKEKALQEAEKQEITKNQFVATMSHELRTPLHGILGLTRILQKQTENPDSLQKIAAIEKSGEHLLSLINSVLDFSRIEAGKFQLESKIFNLQELSNEAIEILRPTANEKGLTLRENSEVPADIWVTSDPQKVKQVLLNLLGNAIKFTKTGTISISTDYECRTEKFSFKVTDTGIGISVKDLPTIFEPYKQAKNISGSITGGTGLGLTIAREICRAMKGDIICHSEVGVGSTFSFTAQLPRSQTSEKQSLAPLSTKAVAARADNTSDILKSNILVLLAEDNDVNALIAKTMLKNIGASFEHVTNGIEAIERMQRTDLIRPDIILMDCQMPRLDGFEATLRLRSIEEKNNFPRTPIIAITASAMAEDNMKCIQSGMDAYLSKPFSEKQLLAFIKNFTDKSI